MEINFSCFVNVLQGELVQNRRYRTRRAYQTVCHSILAYCYKDPSFSEIFNSEWVKRYEEHLFLTDHRRNTISFYLRILRAIYNKAVVRGLYVNQRDLFRYVFTGMDTTVKRAVSSQVIQCIRQADLSKHPKLAFARDMFMLSFYLQGISYIDLAYLLKSDVKNGRITYHRRKTDSPVTVTLEPCAREIIDRYASLTGDSLYLLPIINKSGEEGRKQYETALRTQNRRLGKLSSLLGLEERITTYVARHSWATMAKKTGVPTAVISQGMGHRTEEVTRIYLDSFDDRVLRDANRLVISSVLDSPSETKNVRHLTGDGHFRVQI